MTWLYYSLGAALCYACLNILSRILTIDSKNPRVFSLVFNMICIVMAIMLFVLTNSYKKISLPTQSEAWIYLLIASFFYGINERIRFHASKLLEASVYSVIMNITIVVAFSISLFLYKEILTLSKTAGFFLILIAIAMVIEIKKSKLNLKGLFYGIAGSVMVGISMSLDKKGSNFFNPETYNILIWVIPFIVLYFPGIKIKEIKAEYKKFTWKIVLLALLNFIGFYLGLKAFFLTEATKIIPIIQTSTIITVIFGIFLLNEKNNLFKKILAGIIAVIGVFLLR